MSNKENFWAEDDFEDIVSKTLIACFETKSIKNRGAFPADRMNEKRIQIIRAIGPYIPSNSRLIEGHLDEKNGNWGFDVKNDPLPDYGCVAFSQCRNLGDYKGAYLFLTAFRKTNVLSDGWIRNSGGQLYEYFIFASTSYGIDGERRFFTVTKQGDIHPCDRNIQTCDERTGFRPIYFGMGEKLLKETEIWSSVSMQCVADRRFCWSITAKEDIAVSHLGCMKEEIKSLLYARTLPMTETGRKRPILHLVESHKRRMRSGIDVDVTAFLRGQQTVEIGGTLFKVNPPKVMRPTLSNLSQTRYYEDN